MVRNYTEHSSECIAREMPARAATESIKPRYWRAILGVRNASFFHMDKLRMENLHGTNDGLFSEENAWSGRYPNCSL